MPKLRRGLAPEVSESTYTEKYRGTEWGSPEVPDSPLPEPEPRRWQGLLGTLVFLTGASWIATGLAGLAGTYAFAFLRDPEKLSLPSGYEPWVPAFALLLLVIDLAHIGIGAKVILNPRSDSLGCAGLLYGVAAVALLAALLMTHAVSGWGIVAVALAVVWWGALGVGSLIASQLVE